MAPDPAARSLIIDPAFLGDTIFDGPLARALKHRHPDGQVGLVVRPPSDQIARRLLHVDRVHVFDKRGRDRGLAGLRRVAAELRAEAYQVAYIPHPSLRSVLLARWAGIPRRIGAVQGRVAAWPLSERRPRPSGSFIEARLALLDPSPLGPDSRALAGTLRTPRQDPGGRARIGLLLGSEWATKRWPVERAAEFVARLDPARHQLWLLGGAWERPLYEALRAQAPAALAGAEDRTGGTVEGLIDDLARCQVVVGGDTGPLHLARALGVPTVALFGPTSETLHHFAPEDSVLFESIECRPCSAHGAERCPLGHHRCLVELSAERVQGAVVRALGGR